jgi:NADPH:quinone reductase-like Zn-dependent oxidoreductase
VAPAVDEAARRARRPACGGAPDALRDALGGDVDVVVDPVFGAPATAAASLLAAGGRLVNIGAAAGDGAVFSSATLRSRSAEVLGYTNNALTSDQRNEALRTVVDHAAAGRLGVAHDVQPLSDVENAWRRQRDGETGARVVLAP